MHESIQYDPVAIHNLAKRQYRRSVFVLAFYPAIGALGCGFAGYEIAGYEIGGSLAAVIGAAVGAFLGYLYGSLRSMRLRIQAQSALCLERIEENTRTE